MKISTRPDQNHIILDSFAGSGTTAHSVLELNKSDNGNRKFILIEMEKYADEITAERVRKLSKGIKKSKNLNLQNGFDTGFEYYELKDEIKIDSLLEGKNLPDYNSLAKYIYYGYYKYFMCILHCVICRIYEYRDYSR